MHSQHCGYWCPGAKAPGHQYPQCWLNIHCIGLVSYETIAHEVNSIRKWNHILKKMTQSFNSLRLCDAYICVSELTIIGSDNGLSPSRRQAIIWTNAGILLIGPLRTNFSEILFGIQAFSFNKMHLKMSSGKWRPFCLGLNVLRVKSSWLSHAYSCVNLLVIKWSKW